MVTKAVPTSRIKMSVPSTPIASSSISHAEGFAPDHAASQFNMVQSPVYGPLVQSPVYGPSVQSPVYGPLVQSPVYGHLVQSPVYGPLVQSPVYGPLVQSPVYGPLVQSPVYRSLVQSPVYGPLVQSPVHGTSHPMCSPFGHDTLSWMGYPLQQNPVSSFTLCFIAGNITTYKNKYPKQSQAPYDLCIKHQEWRQFRSPTTATPQSKFGNAYYHCQLKCVWMWHPNFIASGLQVSSEIIVLSSQASHFQCVWTKPIASYQECVV